MKTVSAVRWGLCFFFFLSRASVSVWGCAGLSVEPAGTELCFQKALHRTLAVCLNTHSLCSSLTETRSKILMCWNGIFAALNPHAELRWLSQTGVCLALISACARKAGERKQNMDVSFNLIHSNTRCEILPHSFRHLSRWKGACAVSSHRCFAPYAYFPPISKSHYWLQAPNGHTIDSFKP